MTDVKGDSIEIEDTLYTVHELDEAKFKDTWTTADDRVMGGKSYSYATYDNACGVFNGTANDDGGGFSIIRKNGDY